MAYTDNPTILSSAQSIAHATNTTAVDSEDHLNFGAADPDLGEGAEVRVTITTTFVEATAGSHYFQLYDSSDDSTFKIIGRSKQLVAADLVDGAVFHIPLPAKVRRYLKSTLIKGSTITTGVIDSDFVPAAA